MHPEKLERVKQHHAKALFPEDLKHPKKEKMNSYSATLPTKQIEYLRAQENPPQFLRDLIKKSIENSIETKKKKLKDLYDYWRLLGDAKSNDEQRQKEYYKRAKATMAKIKALETEIDM